MMIPSPTLDRLHRRALFRQLMYIRMVETAIARRYADQRMRCPVHLSVGQEAAAVGACAPLRPADVVFTTHRGHGHYLAKGGDLRAMLAELHGKATGCCGGRGGSMHLFDDEAGLMASVPIVGSNVPLAVGAALAFVQRGEPHVAVACLGDGALEEGVVYESIHFAAVHRLPVVFFVENNRYSVYTPLEQRQVPAERVFPVARSSADGNDVLAVYEAMFSAVERARHSHEPAMVTVETYRYVEHCGPNDDDYLGYRPPAEVAAWKARCPVKGFEAQLRAAGELDEGEVERIRAEIQTEIEDAFSFAESSPMPDPQSLAEQLYAPAAGRFEVVS